MASSGPPPGSVDAYIEAAAPAVRAILRKVRATIRQAAPEAQEKISYRIPAYSLHGVLIYFAAHKAHIGLYPPASGDAALTRELAPYANERGNLRFPLDQPMPYALIERVVKARLRENLARRAATAKPRR